MEVGGGHIKEKRGLVRVDRDKEKMSITKVIYICMKL